MKTVYIYTAQKSNGIKVIIENLMKFMNINKISYEHIVSLQNIPKDAFILPYGVNESLELIKLGYKTKCSLLIDAISLGYLNKIKFYIKKLHVFNFDFFYSIYAYFKYSKKEKTVVKNYNKIVLVSQVDIFYLQQMNVETEYICLKNGANIPLKQVKKEKSPKIRLGILSNWGSKQTFEETNWFIQKYLKKYIKDNNSIEVLIAGRGERIKEFKNIPNVNVLGEVELLSEFFSKSDIFVVANPKGCGILNRILDAFANKTLVLGHKNSFTGFSALSKGFLSFDSYQEFSDGIDFYSNNLKEIDLMINNAYKFIEEHHSWQKNYDKFVKENIKYLCSK